MLTVIQAIAISIKPFRRTGLYGHFGSAVSFKKKIEAGNIREIL
jgi:hypothetical protein